MTRAALGLGVVCVGVHLMACSSGSGNEAADAGAQECRAYVPDADLPGPPVSFLTGVLPLFAGTCSAQPRPCHGDPIVTAEGRPFLGAPDGGTDPMFIAAQIVGVRSVEDPAMNLVTSGDPAQSYLMHKLDGDQCTLASACAVGHSSATDCGWFMPYRADSLLPVQTRDVVRQWIAQNAPLH